MTWGWTGVCRPVFRKLPSSNYRRLSSYPDFMMNFGGKLPIFDNDLLISGKPTKENLPKKGPLFREFWTQKPTHMGGTYPYPQHVMSPPLGFSRRMPKAVLARARGVLVVFVYLAGLRHSIEK